MSFTYSKAPGGSNLKKFYGKSASSEHAARAHRTRKRVAQELLSTEESYINSLRMVCMHFQKPLLSAAESSRPILSHRDINLIFSNIKSIRDLNVNFYLDLRRRIENYTINTRLGKVLLDFVPYFKMYTKYVEHTENKETREIMKMLDANTRIPRYKLLVTEYLKNTAKSHPDYQDLLKALEKIEETAEYMNESIKKAENRAKIIEISDLFSQDPGFVSPSRSYEMDGILFKRSRKEDIRYRFFLFNDILAYAKETKDGYVLHRRIPIDSSFMIRPVKDKTAEPISFQIMNSVKSFEVYSANAEEKEKWMKSFAAVTKRVPTESNGKHSKSHQRAVLQFRKLEYCQIQKMKNGKPCRRKFGLFTKRHNCKKCGSLCCASCSPYHVYIYEGAARKERVCTMCIRPLMELKSNRNLYKPKNLPSIVEVSSLQTRSQSVPEASNQQSHFSCYEEGVHGTIHILLIGAKDLYMKNRTPNSYVIFSRSGLELCKSAVARKSESPVWNQNFKFYVEDLQDPMLAEIRDANSISGQDDKIGQAIVDICLLGRKRGLQHWTEIPLKLDNGTLAGTIEMKIKFTPAMRKKKEQTSVYHYSFTPFYDNIFDFLYMISVSTYSIRNVVTILARCLVALAQSSANAWFSLALTASNPPPHEQMIIS
eukprot:jgi/Bigna1/126101/aug1.2_g809